MGYRGDVDVRVGDVALAAILTVPPQASGVVVFAHGSGSGRLSPRNRAVADVLVDSGFGTLLLDLLTPSEEQEDAVTPVARPSSTRITTLPRTSGGRISPR